MNPVDTVGASQVSGWDVAIALLVLVAAVILARITRKATARLLRRLEGISPGVRAGTARAAEWSVILLGLGVALSALGADVQPLQTAAIVAAVVAFLALRGVAGQFIAGILLRTSHPYRVGDHIETGEHVGIVRQITGVTTVVETYDGRLVHVPNLEVATNPVINRTARGGLRVDVEVRARGVGSVEEVQELIRAAAAAAPHVLPDPPVVTWLRAAEPGQAAIVVKAFHAPELDSDVVAGGLAGHLFAELARAGIPSTVLTPLPPEPITVLPPS